MYDLRDGSYVPPHLRGPDSEQPKPAVPAQPWAGVSAAPVTVTQVPHTPQWAARAATRGPQEMYPFKDLQLGCSFIIQAGDAKIEGVRSMCSKKGTKLRRRFRCHKHPDGTIEVWRER